MYITLIGEFMRRFGFLLLMIIFIFLMSSACKSLAVDVIDETLNELAVISPDESNNIIFEKEVESISSEVTSLEITNSELSSSNLQTYTPSPESPLIAAIILPLSPLLESQILTDWLKNTYNGAPAYDGTNARIVLYLGTYCDNVVIVIDDMIRGISPIFPLTTAGLEFEYGNQIIVWRNGEIKSLMVAFEMDWITLEDMQTIQTLTLVNKLPRAMLLEELSIEIEERMRSDFRTLNSLSDDDYVWVKYYLGTYHDKIAVVMDGPFYYLAVLTQETINEITFSYGNSGPRIQIWDNGEFYGLQQAYDLALITQNDLIEIQQRWSSG